MIKTEGIFLCRKQSCEMYVMLFVRQLRLHRGLFKFHCVSKVTAADKMLQVPIFRGINAHDPRDVGPSWFN